MALCTTLAKIYNLVQMYQAQMYQAQMYQARMYQARMYQAQNLSAQKKRLWYWNIAANGEMHQK